MLKTTSQPIEALARDIVASSEATFGRRCLAVYAMGSLARGGFSEVASDIDIGIILDGPLRSDDGSVVDGLLAETLERHGTVKNRVSIFWGSVDSINGAGDLGRCPPFDRMDLIDHGLLLSGTDVRDRLSRPSKRELEISGAEFSLSFLASDERIEEFHDCRRIASKGTVYVTKTVLFPARFIYLERTGEVAGNEASYRNYVDEFAGPDVELVRRGYQWRVESLPASLTGVVEALEEGLVPLYRRFIDIYTSTLRGYGEEELARRLEVWRGRIERM